MRKNTKKMVLILATLFTILFATSASAQSDRITGLRQTNSTQKAIDIAWDALPYGNVYYYLETSLDGVNWEYAGNAYEDNEFSVYEFKPATTVYIRVTAEEDEQVVAESDVLTATTAPAKVEGLRQTGATTSGITIDWNASEGATGYQIKSFANGRTQYIGETTSTSYTINNMDELLNGWQYIYVVPVRNIGNYTAQYDSFASFRGDYVYLESDEIKLVPKAIKSIKISAYNNDTKNIGFTFDGPQYSTGYEYGLYTYNNKKVKYGVWRGSSSNGFTKLKNTFYIIKIRPYTYVNGKKLCGSWFQGSFAFQPKVKFKQLNGKVKASWNKVSGAKKYVVYMSDKKGSGHKKIKTTKKRTIKISKFKKKGLKKGKSYYVYVSAVRNIGGHTYTSYAKYCYRFVAN